MNDEQIIDSSQRSPTQHFGILPDQPWRLYLFPIDNAK